jgi:hypothetical protein
LPCGTVAGSDAKQRVGGGKIEREYLGTLISAPMRLPWRGAPRYQAAAPAAQMPLGQKKKGRRSADLLLNKKSKEWHKTAKGPSCAEESGLHFITGIGLAN